MKNAMDALNKSFLFCNISEDKAEELLRESCRRSFSAGEVLDSNKSICLIVAGKAAVFKGKSFLRYLEKGDLFGVATLFSEESDISRVVAKTKTEAVFISEVQIAKLIKASNDFSMKYIAFLSDRIRYLNKKIDYYVSSDTASTLLKFINDLPDGKDGVKVIDMNMQSLARSLNIGRASLYRAFDKLEAEGIIKKEKNKIKII